MLPNQKYFQRNRGPWDWQIQMKIISWVALSTSSIPLFSKISLSVFFIIQRLLGPFRMNTNVDYKDDDKIVRHSTMISVMSVAIYKSEKKIFLLEDGLGLRLEGVEYFWPFNFWAVPFQPKSGQVDSSSSRATYKMPMASTECDCRTFLDLPNGYIEAVAPGIYMKFSLTRGSQETLAARTKTFLFF